MTHRSTGLPQSVPAQALIEEIVAAVQAGHNGRIGYLLRLFSVQSDIPALFALRDALHDDSLDRPGPHPRRAADTGSA